MMGIDPDAGGFECALVEGGSERPKCRRFSVSTRGLEEFVRWVAEEEPQIVAVEGIHGQSEPIEKALRKAGVVFYSLVPRRVEKYRKAVLGENKNNRLDAEAVAGYALSLREQGRLERWRGVWEPDGELRLLSRRHESVGKQINGETNRLWKVLRAASGDLYLALGGGGQEAEGAPGMLENKGILTLISNEPQLGGWKELSEDALMAAMGGGEYRGRRQLLRNLRPAMERVPAISESMQAVIRGIAGHLVGLRQEQGQIEGLLERLGEDRPSVLALDRRPGIGRLTACTIVAEIIDIRRFPAEKNLASYSGLGRVEFKTGNQERERQACGYNRRLKDALMTAARNVVRFDPESHLAGYQRWLLKRGMEPCEVTKRVARALVRVIYRELKALVEPDRRTTPAGAAPRRAGAAKERGARKPRPSHGRQPSRSLRGSGALTPAKGRSRRTAHPATGLTTGRRAQLKESS